MNYWRLRQGGVTVMLESANTAGDQLIESALAQLLAPVDASSLEKEREVTLRLDFNNERWLLEDLKESLSFKFTQVGDCLYHLTDRMVFHVANNAVDHHCVHAGAVAYNGRAILCPAHSGAGKSSFITWLVAQGFEYISDELVLIDRADKLSGLARPIQIKQRGLGAISSLLKEGCSARLGEAANSVLVEDLNGQYNVAPAELGVLIFPNYAADSTYSFTPISRAHAGMKIMGNHVNARNLSDHGFRDMMAKIRSLPSYELNYSGFASLPATFDDELKALLAG